jgi:hypothetical protein
LPYEANLFHCAADSQNAKEHLAGLRFAKRQRQRVLVFTPYISG